MATYLPPPSGLPSGSTVWAYLRDSGGPTQGESIERQRTEIQNYCARYGLALVHVFEDEARSGGSTAEREQFDEMISASTKSSRPAGLLLWDFARFSRSVDDSGYFKAVLRRTGLIIHSITDAIPEGPYSRMVELIIDMANEEKRKQTKRDTSSGLRRIVEQYGAMPGPAPTGYKREPIDVGKRRDGSPHILHRWIPDPEKVPLVRQAFEMRAAGKTLPEIRKATGLFVSKNSFSTFFNNSVYRGQIQFSGKYYPCEPIVSTELWNQVQELGELRGRDRYTTMARRRINSPYILSGLVFCQECGSPLNGYQLLGDRHYYVCSRARRRGDCGGRHVPAAILENGIIQKLVEDILTPENLLKVQDSLQVEQVKFITARAHLQQDLKKQLSAIQTKINRFTAAIGDGGHTKALLDALHAAEGERGRIEYELEKAERFEPTPTLSLPTLEQIAAAITKKLTGDDLQAKRDALRSAISRILVLRTDSEIRVLIEYKPLVESNIPPQGGGDVSNSDGGPDGI